MSNNIHEITNSIGSCIVSEVNNLDEPNGRVKIKAYLHEIFDDSSKFQENGISWSEEYTLKSIHTVFNMPITAEFIDDEKTLAWGHGMTESKITATGDELPLFENAVTIGVFNKGYIDKVQIRGEVKKVLVAEGILYEQHYPKFIDELKSDLSIGEVHGSIEITGLKKNNNRIIYVDDKIGEGRIPKEYEYTGYAILSNSVKAGDSSALIAEVNNKQKNKEDLNMGTTEINAKEIAEEIFNKFSELNAKEESKNARIKRLETELIEKDNQIEKLRKEWEDLKEDEKEKVKKLEEQNKLVEENKKLKTDIKIRDLNAMLEEFDEDIIKENEAYIEAFKKDSEKNNVEEVKTRLDASYGERARKRDRELNARDKSSCSSKELNAYYERNSETNGYTERYKNAQEEVNPFLNDTIN